MATKTTFATGTGYHTGIASNCATSGLLVHNGAGSDYSENLILAQIDDLNPNFARVVRNAFCMLQSHATAPET